MSRSPPRNRPSSRCRGSCTGRRRPSWASSCRSAASQDTADRIARKQEQIAAERRSAEEQSRAQEAREDEARASIVKIEADRRVADEHFHEAQRKVYEGRQALQAQSQRTADAKAGHAALVERASGLAIEIQRLEEASPRARHARRQPARRSGARAVAPRRTRRDDRRASEARSSMPAAGARRSARRGRRR
jgi:fused signal recognition particle receptor